MGRIKLERSRNAGELAGIIGETKMQDGKSDLRMAGLDRISARRHACWCGGESAGRQKCSGEYCADALEKICVHEFEIFQMCEGKGVSRTENRTGLFP